jgi:hypothetical protein
MLKRLKYALISEGNKVERLLMMMLICLVGNVNIVRNNAEHFLQASKQSGLEINIDKSKYMSTARN